MDAQQDKPTTICAWCEAVLEEGGPEMSHGICTACAEEFIQQLDLACPTRRRSTLPIAS